MDSMATIFTRSSLRAGSFMLAILFLGLLATPAQADNYGYYGGSNSHSGGSSSGGWGYSGGHHSGGGSYTPPVAMTSYSSNNGRHYSYSTGYRSGGSGFNFVNFRGSVDTNTGYSGANTFIATPHRADWNAKINAQRRWDEQQYAKYQQGNGAGCGFTTSPAYCYKLMGPYPSEMKIVRY